MVQEVIEGLHITADGKYIDGTLGAGGHTIEILQKGGKVMGIDDDATMIEIAGQEIAQACPDLKNNFQVHNGNFRNIKNIATQQNFFPVNGVLLDLGISSKHLDNDTRGFSFKDPHAPLDMRLNTSTQSVTAAQLLNSLREEQLFELFQLGMDYSEAKKWSKNVICQRETQPFETVGDLLKISPDKYSNINPATKAFMALRIAVNTEYENLKEGLEGAFEILAQQGRLVIITFHSGEDRIVKQYFKKLVDEGNAKEIGQQPIMPSEEEIKLNPRARSAKVRIIEKNTKTHEIHKLSQAQADYIQRRRYED